jgi:hypothetical protein
MSNIWLGRRTEPRVDFNESVRVIWPGEVSGVVARGVNLSAAGILIDAPTPTPCPVGSDVLCDVALPNGQRLLRGRVAHRRLLSPANIGMGIEFVDLSPVELAELRDVVGLSDERPQRVKVRFEGTTQIVRARAQATEHGFRLATALPFLRAGTGMDVALAAEPGLTARAWVSSVALDLSHHDGVPRLVIDVLGHPRDPWDKPTPVVETLRAEAEPVDENLLREEDLLPAEDVPTIVTASPELPAIVEGPLPTAHSGDHDATQIIPLEERVPSRWKALTAGGLAGMIAFATFVVIVVGTRTAPKGPVAPVSISPPVIVPQPPAPAAVAPAPVEPAPVVEEPALHPAVVEETPAAEPGAFQMDLEGTTTGAHRYVLRAPDGIGYNLPHAKPAAKFGTYHPEVAGLRAVWLRPLPGGGTNARFYFKPGEPPPKVELVDGALRVAASDQGLSSPDSQRSP